MEDISRRKFLGAVGATVASAGCASNPGNSTETSTGTETGTTTGTATDTATETDTPEETETETEETEEEPEVDRPSNYRWDMSAWVNTELRNELGQYTEGNTNRVVGNHPTFEYSTESPRDDQPIDFAGLKLYRESSFDLLSQDPGTSPMERIVNSFVDSSLYEEAKTNAFLKESRNAPSGYDSESWQNADSVEESLDLGHSLLVSIASGYEQVPYDEQAGIIREAYKRHHDFDVLAWSVPMRAGSFQAGMMYSPNDDKVRTFNNGGEAWSGSGEAQSHTEIQNWRVIEDPNNEARGEPTNFHHPVLFHTEDWDRGTVSGFEEAKRWNADMLTGIAAESHRQLREFSEGVFDNPNFAMTTGLQKKGTRTLLEYNNTEEADFQNLWDLANITLMLEDYHGDSNFVIDTGVENDDYNGIFNGNIAVYEVEDESVLEDVWADQTGEYDNFGQVYDELEAV